MNKGSDALQASLVSYQEWLTKKGGAKLTIASYLTDQIGRASCRERV